MSGHKTPLARAVGVLASPRFTILNFTLLLLNALLIKPLKLESLGFFSLAIGLMFLNLLFCMIKRRFRSAGVTVFHMALLFFIASVWLSSLFYFYGYIELAEGQRDGVQRFVRGILHTNDLERATLLQGEVAINYSGKSITDFSSGLTFKAPTGERSPVLIQFLNSFHWRGYDFYLHRERGYAVELEFMDESRKKRGYVDLPDYVRNPEGQTKYFDIPGEEIGFVATLKFKENRDFSGEWTFDIPEDTVLLLERGGEEYSLKSGQLVELSSGGAIRFLGVRRWVNYVVYKNSFAPLLAYSGGAAFFALLYHLLTGTNLGLWKRLS